MQKTSQFEKAPESEVWNAISAFEQILEAMPEDRTALETLYEAYEHIGDRGQALQYVLRLGEVVLEEQDTAPIVWLYSEVQRLGSGNPKAEASMKRMEDLMVANGMPSPADIAPQKRRPQTKINIASEMSMAWNLLQVQVLTQAEYSTIVEDLTENSTKVFDVPVTVQHVLHDRTMPNQERVIEFLCRDSTLPFIRLPDFDLDAAPYNLLPMEYAERKGAIVFETMGSDALVAILNPYHYELRAEVEKEAKKKCHFFLVTAEDYDQCLTRIRGERKARRSA